MSGVSSSIQSGDRKEKWNPNTKIDGMTLSEAVETNRLDIVQQFAQKYDVDWDCDEYRISYLWRSINKSSLDVFKFLLTLKNVNVNWSSNLPGQLSRAAIVNESDEYLKLLVLHPEFKINHILMPMDGVDYIIALIGTNLII